MKSVLRRILLAVVVIGINIGTLGLGAFLTGMIKFVAALITPSVALIGVSQLMPGALHGYQYVEDGTP